MHTQVTSCVPRLTLHPHLKRVCRGFRSQSPHRCLRRGREEAGVRGWSRVWVGASHAGSHPRHTHTACTHTKAHTHLHVVVRHEGNRPRHFLVLVHGWCEQSVTAVTE